MNKTEERTFLELLWEMPDHRKGNAIQHNLGDILTIEILSLLYHGDTFTGMQLFGETHEEELRHIWSCLMEYPHMMCFGMHSAVWT